MDELVAAATAAGEAVKAAKAGQDKAAIKTAVDALVAIKEKITALDPGHPMALVDKAAKKKSEKEKKKQEAAAAAGGDEGGPSKNAQKAAAKKALKDAKKRAHKEGAARQRRQRAPKAAAPKAAAPKPTKAPPKAADGAVAAALAAACSRTAAAPFATATLHAGRSRRHGPGRVDAPRAGARGHVDGLGRTRRRRRRRARGRARDAELLGGRRLTLADAACYARGAQIAAAPSPAAARWLDQVRPSAAPSRRPRRGPPASSACREAPARSACQRAAPAKGAAQAAPARAAPRRARGRAEEGEEGEEGEAEEGGAAPAAAGPASDGSPEGDCLASAPALDVRVGTVVKCWEHPEAEKLYCEEIDIGEEAGPRTIASGLRPFYGADDIRGRKVLIFANLKARTMQGFKSCGMVLCASNADHTVVKLLEVPAGAKNGDRVAFGDLAVVPPAAPSAVQKKKLLEKVIGFLKTDGDGVATVLGKKFALPAGPVTAPGMPDAAIS
ncbi:tRNA binding protein [Aureococcus anophagefferens]|nr:tRNA binding protein [Aureococcus anophagefferens]